jgi:hypothetical protein
VPSWSEFGLAFQRTKPKPPFITSNEDGLRIISNNNSKIRNSLSLLRKSYGLFGQRELGHGKVDAAVAHWKLQKRQPSASSPLPAVAKPPTAH